MGEVLGLEGTRGVTLGAGLVRGFWGLADGLGLDAEVVSFASLGARVAFGCLTVSEVLGSRSGGLGAGFTCCTPGVADGFGLEGISGISFGANVTLGH